MSGKSVSVPTLLSTIRLLDEQICKLVNSITLYARRTEQLATLFNADASDFLWLGLSILEIWRGIQVVALYWEYVW